MFKGYNIMQVRTLAEFKVKPGEEERFKKAYLDGQMLERATTNPGFICGELLCCGDNPGVFIATAQWCSEDAYRAWQQAYSSLPKAALKTMLSTLEQPITSRICRIVRTADQNTILDC